MYSLGPVAVTMIDGETVLVFPVYHDDKPFGSLFDSDGWTLSLVRAFIDNLNAKSAN
jgi:hypothetical protein